MYRIDIMTLFPDVVGDMLSESILGRGQERGYIRIECHQIRDYTVNKQKQVDDDPYGGGRGAVMQADPLFRCWEHICQEAGERVHTIYMSPAGKTFTQSDARRLKADYDRLILVCGHYEGIDERFIEECVDEEISLGDFVMTGGEIPAMAVADAVCRLVPGVLSDPSCYENESHWNGMLEAPQYSRPEVLKDRMELERLYGIGFGAAEIATKLKVHRSTVYNELKRGDTGEMDENGRFGYSAELAQQRLLENYRQRRTARA